MSRHIFGIEMVRDKLAVFLHSFEDIGKGFTIMYLNAEIKHNIYMLIRFTELVEIEWLRQHIATRVVTTVHVT
jgi:hypothetical protein